MNDQSKISLIGYTGPVLDQGAIGSCLENAFVTIIDMEMREAGDAISLRSRLQSYADTRIGQNTFNTDSGSAAEVAFIEARIHGLASESSWQYDNSLLFVKPTADVYAEAANYKLDTYTIVNESQQYSGISSDIKGYLDQGKPVILAFIPGPEFFKETGPLADQKGTWTANIDTGGHAVAIVGYDDTINGGSYIIKNSWGTGWGDGGYGTVTYQQMGAYNHDFTGAYVIDGFAGKDFEFTDAKKIITELYVAILGRAPDIQGLEYWAKALDSKVASALQIADSFFSSAEGIADYAGTARHTVDKLFMNTLGHVDSWADAFLVSTKLTSGEWSKGDLVEKVIALVENYAGTDAQRKTDAALFAHKTDVAEWYAIALQSHGDTSAAMHALDGVTSDPASVEVVKVGISHELNLFY